MGIQLVHYTDCGPVRPANQDAYCALLADTQAGPISLLAVCDGMGGLSSGEVASATVIFAFVQWFQECLPKLAACGTLRPEQLSDSWNEVLRDCHRRLKTEADCRGIRWGTTLSLILMTRKEYYLLHVGDSRIYLADDAAILQLTQDQTLAMQKVTSGTIAPETYEQDARRNILLQCIGNRSLSPTFRMGEKPRTGAVLLCSDGFCHTLQPADLRRAMMPTASRTQWQDVLAGLADRARQKGETDNITVVALRWDDLPAAYQATLPLIQAAQPADHFSFRAKVVCTNAEPI